MKPLQIILVGNRNGVRKIRWIGVLATACVLTAIASPIAAVSAMFMGALPVVMTAVLLVWMLTSMVRVGLSAPLEKLPILD